MEEEQKIEVDVTKQQTGKITFFSNVNYPTPTKLALITKALRYFSVGVITSIAGTDLFTAYQAKAITFGLGLFILLLGGIDIAIGVKPEEEFQFLLLHTATLHQLHIYIYLYHSKK